MIEGASQYGFNLLAWAPVACASLFLLIGGIPGLWLPQEAWNDYYSIFRAGMTSTMYNWWCVDLKGAVGPGTANQLSSNNSKKKKCNPKLDPIVLPFHTVGVAQTFMTEQTLHKHQLQHELGLITFCCKHCGLKLDNTTASHLNHSLVWCGNTVTRHANSGVCLTISKRFDEHGK